MPSWKELEKFLVNDGWSFNKSKSGTDKWYEKRLDDGTLLRARVSKGTGEIGAGLFRSILSQQLFCNSTYFNKVKKKKPKSDNRFPNS